MRYLRVGKAMGDPSAGTRPLHPATKGLRLPKERSHDSLPTLWVSSRWSFQPVTDHLIYLWHHVWEPCASHTHLLRGLGCRSPWPARWRSSGPVSPLPCWVPASLTRGHNPVPPLSGVLNPPRFHKLRRSGAGELGASSPCSPLLPKALLQTARGAFY